MRSWFGSRSSNASRHAHPAQTPQARLQAPSKTKGEATPTDSQSVLGHSQSLSTLGPSATFSPASSQLALPFSEVHGHVNEPSAYKTSGFHHLGPMPEMREGADLDESSGALSSLRLDDDYAGVDGKQPKRDKDKGRESEGPLFTPQDAVLSEVFGFKPPAKTDPVGPSATSLEANADSISWSRSDADLSTLPPSLPIYDPFTGAKIGDHPPLCATTGAPANTTPSASTDPQARPQNIMHSLPTADDSELWNHLSRILELQAEVATMHTELEGFGSSGRGGASTGATSDTRPPVAKLSNPKKRTRGETIPMGDDDEPQPPPGGSGSQAIVTDSSSEDEDEDDAEGYAKRKRDEEFAKLEEQFRERKVAITRIMDKLGELSGTLKAFHALPTPAMDLMGTSTSRVNTVSSMASDASPESMSSPPPHRTRFFQSPASSTRAAQPTTSSAASAPPRITTSKIIIDAQHVDSPVDMHPTQSAFGIDK